MGFHTMAAMVVTDHSPNLSEFQSVTNAPPDYMPTFEDANSAKLDPVSQHCKRSSSPLVWAQNTYVVAGRADFWEEQAAFGFQSGICVAFHLPRGRHFMFGITSDRHACAARKAMFWGLTLDTSSSPPMRKLLLSTSVLRMFEAMTRLLLPPLNSMPSDEAWMDLATGKSVVPWASLKRK